ncbi:hypothetical protein HMPREF0880_03576 [Yokenella regensburgei ATCC 43003]|nr:hypothetical protein HMPREF0880_03576 [Yokenella regensburgei ATCC 43003]
MADAITIVQVFGPVNREPDHKAMLREKARPFFVEQDPVGL